jgi:large subunit ribosomal protein L11
MPETIEALVDAGQASAGPPLGPALGPLGLNIMNVIKAINDKTKDFGGMKVPVKVIVDTATKEFEVSVGTPPTSALIKGELGSDKGSQRPGLEYAGNLTLAQVKKIARMKGDSLLGKNIKAKALEVVGSCTSVGIKVEGKEPKEMQRLINNGDYDAELTE